MNWLENLLTPALVRAVGYTILHSLWQGAVVAIALAGLLLLLRRHSPQVRYGATAAALGLVLLLAAVTFVRYYLTALPGASNGPVTAVLMVSDAVGAQSNANGAALLAPDGPLSLKTVLRYTEQHLPLLVTLWFMGLLTMTLRMLGGLAYVQRLRHYGTQPLGVAWQNRLANLAERAGLQRPVALMESSMVRVPMVIGHLRPVILLPLGAVAGLSTLQLEAILAHELAHVVRRDYLVNLLQSVAEILLFYHPAVWFLTATLRSERENCCDDVAASLCGNPLVLARALAALAELGLERAVAPRLTMAAVGPKGSLLGRVRRLVQGRTAPTFSEGFMAACVVMGGLVLLSFTAAAALANPRLAAEAPRLLRSTVLKPFIPDVEAALPPVDACPDDAALAAVPVANRAAAADDDDDKRKRKNKRNGDTRVVVVDRTLATRGRRGEPGTVVIEKDKKGRLKELYVNGQRVETGEADRRGGKSAKPNEEVRVIQLPAAASGRHFTPGTYEFHFDNGLDEKRLRSQLRRLEVGPGVVAGPSEGEVRVITREALVSAERALAKARTSGELSEEERERIEEELDRIREQRDEMRERDAEQRAREAEVRSRYNEERARYNEERARYSEERARANEERAREREARAREREAEARERERKFREGEEAFIKELSKEGLISDPSSFQLLLNNSRMVVNGKEQPESMRRKFLDLWAKHTGRTMSGSTSLSISRNGGNSNIWISGSDAGQGMVAPPAAPVPPVPPVPPTPRAPRAPRGRAGSMDPLPPLPPAAPRAPRGPSRSAMVNGVNLGEELRKDGLIGDADRSYEFRLNNTEMVVNGKKQPAATASKYRKLLGGDKGGKVDINIVLKED
ncbi:M56 family metallopeptidase [Hymenobacter latericus]|uniref:M56 family metallopeptidase n=1 Tax=Hymenobacter sp. YIM 151858-1 TaxID=2987688 RepID=UPI002226CFA6|nr:M56 family metallopeptidase [Hymenobacter sp. YIM 151858-1]UYZ59168.1 M56 family metallopeptidase [Hymenobacter sp. YIM 151858-1]